MCSPCACPRDCHTYRACLLHMPTPLPKDTCQRSLHRHLNKETAVKVSLSTTASACMCKMHNIAGYRPAKVILEGEHTSGGNGKGCSVVTCECLVAATAFSWLGACQPEAPALPLCCRLILLTLCALLACTGQQPHSQLIIVVLLGHASPTASTDTTNQP